MLQGGTARVYLAFCCVLKIADNDILKSEANKYRDLDIGEVSLYVPRCFAYVTFGRWHMLVLSSCGDTTLKPFTIAKGPRMTNDEIRRGFLQILGVLAYMHETCKMVHRDIKPENICVDKTGAWRLVDFGSAVYTDTNADDSDALSSSDSPKYLPPEHILQKTHDDTPMRDVYALGIIVCELYDQCTPFPAEHEYWRKLTIGKELPKNFPDIVNRGSRKLPILPSSMPSDLQPVVRKMLNCDPTKRYQTAREAYDDAYKALRATT